MSDKKEKAIEKLKDIAFAIFYFGLFILEMLPSFAIMFFELSSPWLWIVIVIGIIAMIIQAKEFGCHNIITFQAGMIGAIIAAILIRYVF